MVSVLPGAIARMVGFARLASEQPRLARRPGGVYLYVVREVVIQLGSAAVRVPVRVLVHDDDGEDAAPVLAGVALAAACDVALAPRRLRLMASSPRARL
jgi:hypothetical protein